jgi:membrane protein required for colicin V production
MQTYDLIMIVLLIGATAWGAYKGLAWQIASLASLVVSYLVAFRFSEPLAPYLSHEAPLNRLLAMLLLYAASSLVIWLLFRFVAGFINRLRLQEFDRQMGAIIGAAKGVLLCLIVTFCAAMLTIDPLRTAILASHSGRYMAYALHRAPAIMPKEVEGVLGPFLKQLDEQLQKRDAELKAGAAAPPPRQDP